MKIYNLVVIFITLTLFTLLTSCGEQATGKRKIASTGESFSALEIKSLDANQLNIAYRICLAFKSKRVNWHLDSTIGKTAKITYEEKGCNTNSVDVYEISPDPIISAPTLSSQITFASLSSIRYFSDVQTDLHGTLKSVCPTVASGSNVFEFYDENKVTRVYMTFETMDSDTDRFTLKYSTQDPENQEFYISHEVVSYDVQTSNASKIMSGTVTEINSSAKCGDSQNSSNDSTKKQTLISIL